MMEWNIKESYLAQNNIYIPTTIMIEFHITTYVLKMKKKGSINNKAMESIIYDDVENVVQMLFSL
jgi:DNA-binding ferritin-like protein (Dps family)